MKKRMKSRLMSILFVLSYWILPQKIRELLKSIWHHFKIESKKNWRYTPITIGLHDNPMIASTGKMQYWLSLNKELRAGIIISEDTSLSTNMIENQSGWIQFGIGKKEDSQIKEVVFSINNSVVALISDITPEQWQTVRVAFPEKNVQCKIDITLSGKGDLFLCEPQIFKKSLKNNSKNQTKNIICIVLDGLTSELINEKHTPNISRFFRDGVSCSQAFTQGDWTLPSFSSMLTGLYPANHGVVNPLEFESHLDEKILTLPEMLRNNGFRTFGFSSHSRFGPAYGHSQGFERFFFNLLDNDNFCSRQVHEASQHLEAHKEESNFLFLHFLDSHFPYNPSGYLKNVLMSPIRRPVSPSNS